ncbi:ornithine carbamoyltransferase [Thermoflavimicrobium dichotomicum]|uniref:Ornithine carbamoyltransferase n=1 Tax=Thermoflavimicrobium dichotomicum TaxID=46223 RepID=A0A1I3NYE6_9BACL|nr:ornithine carbamoyltransferase [Thermoflavimicrobium dichotomicum]SFJ14167.1 ornithine carbamoyltransferase [Thermoflavimicrobium dichotomicum]
MAVYSLDSVLQGLKGKDCLTLTDYTPEEIQALIKLAVKLKQEQKAGVKNTALQGKVLAMMFDKPSTRTRVSFAVGMAQLGGQFLELSSKEMQYGRGESLEDTARTLSGYVDAIMIRTFSQQMVEELAKHATVPVINGLTDLYHPCQALADLLTLMEEKGDLSRVKLAYVGDGNNVLHSLMHGAAAVGMTLTIATPKGYEPLPKVWDEIEKVAKQTGAQIQFYYDPMEAVKEADAIYTDVWASMGQEEEKEKRKKDFAEYQVNETLMKQAKADAIFMHCLPAYRGLEVTAEVIDGPQSVVFQQAENRLHAQKALLLSLLG